MKSEVKIIYLAPFKITAEIKDKVYLSKLVHNFKSGENFKNFDRLMLLKIWGGKDEVKVIIE